MTAISRISLTKYVIRKQSLSECSLWLSGGLAGDTNPSCRTILGETSGNATIKQSAHTHWQGLSIKRVLSLLSTWMCCHQCIQHSVQHSRSRQALMRATRSSLRPEHSSQLSQIFVIKFSNEYKASKLVAPIRHHSNQMYHCTLRRRICVARFLFLLHTRVGTLIVATIYLQLIQNRYMFRNFTVLQCSHQHCVQPVASDVEVVGYL